MLQLYKYIQTTIPAIPMTINRENDTVYMSWYVYDKLLSKNDHAPTIVDGMIHNKTKCNILKIIEEENGIFTYTWENHYKMYS